MNYKKSKLWILGFVAALVPIVITLVLYKQLPDQMPVHWGINGEVNRYGDKDQVWITGLMGMVILIFMYFLPSIDPRKANYDKFGGAYAVIAVFITIFMAAIHCVTLLESIHPGSTSITFLVTIGIGLLFMVIGNYMPKMKSNFFAGIKTPWTLSSVEVWNKTHRLAGRLWLMGGFIMIASGFIKNSSVMFSIMMGVVLVLVFIPIIMSYVWYSQEHRRGR